MQWKDQTITRMNLGVSEETPVKVITNRFPTPGESLFDMHYPVELGIVLEGRMTRFYREYELEIGPGDTWLCGIWEPHGFRVTACPCETIAVTIYPPMLANTHYPEAGDINWLSPFMVPPENRPVPEKKKLDEVLMLAKRIKQEAAGNSCSKKIRLRFYLMELLLLLLETTPAPPPQAVPVEGRIFDRINRAVQLAFEQHRMVTVQEAAEACGMSRNAFSTLFKNVMGIPFPQFSLRHRLRAAAAQLRNTNDPLKAIAEAQGFTDESHLHRCFSKIYGLSPGRYRQQFA